MTPAKDNGPILVAIDFSDDSEEALLWADNYTKCNKAPLIILHVIHDPADAPGFYRQEEDDWSVPMASAANKIAEKFMKEMHDKHPSRRSLKEARLEFVQGLPPVVLLNSPKKKMLRSL